MRPRIATALIVLGLIVGSSAGVVAQRAAPASDPARIAAAKELFAVSGQEAQFDTVIATMTQGLAGIFKQQHPRHGPAIDDAMRVLRTKFSARKSEVIDMVAPLYAEEFSAEELAAMAAFYQTPVGRKLVEKQPQIIQKSMMFGMQWGQKIGQEVDAEFRSELRRRGLPI